MNHHLTVRNHTLKNMEPSDIFSTLINNVNACIRKPINLCILYTAFTRRESHDNNVANKHKKLIFNI